MHEIAKKKKPQKPIFWEDRTFFFCVLNTLEKLVTVSIAFAAWDCFSKRGNGTVHTKYMKMQNG